MLTLRRARPTVEETEPLNTVLFVLYGFYICLFIIKMKQENYQAVPIGNFVAGMSV